ncbi:MAG: tetratricopeptide repeat protein [Acidobacteria bacterium]|nr:tetratricopeptide repeat protein [Acidobacteriota bacterium]
MTRDTRGPRDPAGHKQKRTVGARVRRPARAAGGVVNLPGAAQAKEWRRLADELEAFLYVGDFNSALARFSPEIMASMFTEALPAPLQLRLRAVAAELFSYRGLDNKAAQIWKICSDPVQVLSRNDISARAKHALVVERYYAAREFETARKWAERIKDHCEDRGDILGTGIASYGLARCLMRQHKDVAAVYGECDFATTRFLRAVRVNELDSVTPEDSLFLRWRIGLVLLLHGYTRWTAGDVNAGMSRLLMAKWCLLGTGDPIALANANHSIGTILRSVGAPREALEVLKRARAAYQHADHHLNLARCLTNLGRVQKDLGDFDGAKESLEQALNEARRAENDRQKAETLVWLSWLHQEAKDAKWASMKEAEQWAKEAASMKLPSNAHIASEAAIALGHCELARHEAVAAEQNFLRALENADGRFPKVRIHAELSLAELYCSPRAKDLAKAISHYEKAKRDLESASTSYLQLKQQQVLRMIESFRSDVWSLTTDGLFRDGLKMAEDRLKAWALERVSQFEGSDRNRARRLGISPTGYKKMLTPKSPKKTESDST